GRRARASETRGGARRTIRLAKAYAGPQELHRNSAPDRYSGNYSGRARDVPAHLGFLYPRFVLLNLPEPGGASFRIAHRIAGRVRLALRDCRLAVRAIGREVLRIATPRALVERSAGALFDFVHADPSEPADAGTWNCWLWRGDGHQSAN